MTFYRKVIVMIILLLLMISHLSNGQKSDEEKSRQSAVNFIEMTWEPSEVYVLNGNNGTSELRISYRGPSFFGNLSFECPLVLICPQEWITDIELVHNRTVYINFTFKPIQPSPDPIDDLSIEANFHNTTYSIESRVDLRVHVLFPLSIDPIAPEDLLCDYSFLEGYPKSSWYCMDGEQYHLTGFISGYKDIDFKFQITNQDPKSTYTGYIGIFADYYKSIGRHKFKKIRNPEILTLGPGDTEEIEIHIPLHSLENTVWDIFEFRVVFSEFEDLTQPINIWKSFEKEGRIVGAMQAKFHYEVITEIRLDLIYDPEESVTDRSRFIIEDLWEGTNFTVRYENFDNKVKKDVVVLIEDWASPLSSFSYKKYINVTKVNMGDVGPLKTKKVDVTVYSKISGEHHFRASTNNGKVKANVISPERRGQYFNAFIKSGLELTYLNEINCTDEKLCSNIPDKWVLRIQEENIEDEFTVELKINNTRDIRGDLGLSVFISENAGILSGQYFDAVNGLCDDGGEFCEYDKWLHGNGWVGIENLFEVKPDKIQLDGERDTFKFKVKAKMAGVYFIIPFVKVGNSVLVFDRNFEDQIFNPREEITDASQVDWGVRKITRIEPRADNTGFICLSNIVPILCVVIIFMVLKTVTGFRWIDRVNKRTERRPSQDRGRVSK